MLLPINLSNDKFITEVLKTMGFELQSPCSMIGASGLEYLVSGLAYNQKLNHYLLINYMSDFHMMDKKDLLLQVLDIGDYYTNQRKNLSVVTYCPAPVINKNDLVLPVGLSINNFTDEAIAILKQDKCYKDWLDLRAKMIYRNTKTDTEYSPKFVTNVGEFMFSSTMQVHSGQIGVLPERESLKNFLVNYGGFGIDMNIFDFKDVYAFLATRKKTDKHEFIKKYKMEEYIHPPIDKFLAGLSISKVATTKNEVNQYLENTLELGHRFAAPSILTNDDITTIIEKVKDLKPDSMSGEITLKDGQAHEVKINFEKESMVKSVLTRVIKLTDVIVKRFSLQAKINLNTKDFEHFFK